MVDIQKVPPSIKAHSVTQADDAHSIEKALLSIENLSLYLDQDCVIRDLNLHVNHGETICLLGASGCGKTTTLRAIAGFLQPAQGTITLEGTLTASRDTMIPPEKRHVGMIFQDYALFPHLTAWENIAFGLRKINKSDRERRILHYLKLVHMEKLSDKYPHELSGGQQQRVAVARALAPHPRIILMDEPFSNLDVCLRRELQRQLRSALQKENMTAILVTHDQEEAFAMADRIALLATGELQQFASPYSLYHEPANRYVATFIGLGSFIQATVTGLNQLETEVGPIISKKPLSRPVGHRVDLLLRPDDIIPNPAAKLRALIQHKMFKGASTLYGLTLNNGTPLEAIFPSHFDYPLGSYIHIDIKADHVIVFDTAH